MSKKGAHIFETIRALLEIRGRFYSQFDLSVNVSFLSNATYKVLIVIYLCDVRIPNSCNPVS